MGAVVGCLKDCSFCMDDPPLVGDGHPVLHWGWQETLNWHWTPRKPGLSYQAPCSWICSDVCEGSWAWGDFDICLWYWLLWSPEASQTPCPWYKKHGTAIMALSKRQGLPVGEGSSVNSNFWAKWNKINQLNAHLVPWKLVYNHTWQQCYCFKRRLKTYF